MRKFLLLLALVGAAPLWADDLNWIVNGDFKHPGAGGPGWVGSLNLQPGRDGRAVVYMQNLQPVWTEVSQKVPFPDPPPAAIEISGWLKTENVVRGAQDWNAARISVVFYDASGNRLGDWPPTTAQLTGTHDWALYSREYPVTPGTAWATVELSLGDCTGRAWFSDLACSAYDFDNKPLAAGAKSHPGLKPPPPPPGVNWLLNPGFEDFTSRDWNGGQTVPQGHESAHSRYLENEQPAWTLAQQDVSFNGQTPASIRYGGWLKTEGVQLGTENYMAARLGVDFRDASGKQVGGWQDSACKVTGTTDWTHYERAYAVPPGAASAHLDAGLGNCVGKAWVDDLSLELLDAQGAPLTTQLVTEQKSDTSDWYAYQPPPGPSDTALDLSFLNERPAGTHGFVTVKDGHFAFKDGTRIRFWGTDLVGPNIFLPHEQADALALRLSRLGVNLVRLHMADADWTDNNFFDPKADNTLSLSPPQVDKFDYLVAALKKNGIYVYPDWIVGRKFRAGDQVPDYQTLQEGAKGVIHFSQRIIEMNKLYAKQILTHLNPYTRLTLASDPVYVGNEVVNESSIFTDFSEQNYPPAYWAELQKLYTRWGGKGLVTHFKFDYDAQKLVATRNPENTDATLRFLLAAEEASNRQMRQFLKITSPHALLTGSNMGLPVLGDLRADSLMDFMDTHAYWDHPQFWNIEGGWANIDFAPLNNNSQLQNPFQGALVFNLCHAAVEGKPLIVTEWNDCFPNEYRLEGPVLLTAYGALQDWDGLLQFDYGADKPGTVKMSNFALNTRVDNEPLYQAGALIFREGLLKPSAVTVVEPVADAQVLADGSRGPWLFDHAWLPYAVKVVKRFTGAAQGAAADLAALEGLHSQQGKTIASSTGEETLDYGKGLLTINSPKVQGFVGAPGAAAFQTSDLSLLLSPRNPFAALLAVSLDEKPLAASRRWVLVAQAKAENSGQVFNSTRRALKNPGHPPILMQGVAASLAVRVDPGQTYRVFPLDSGGAKGAALAATQKAGILRFQLSPADK
ncbi:MAG TPA: hypothetical protein VMU88_07745, partial [bacterium]|nr:hypothetical protein [bacterium]